MSEKIIDLFSNLAALAKSVLDWKKGKKEKADLRLFYEEHIKPVYDQMERIHKDYMDGFGGLLKRMRDSELPPRALYDWFEEKRRELDSERIDARNFQVELQTHSFPESEIGSEIGLALRDFVKAVTDYFIAPDSLYRLSFYTDFSRTLKSFVQLEEARAKKMSKHFYDTDFVKDYYEQVEKAVDVYLPKHWNEFSIQYHRIKGLLLK